MAILNSTKAMPLGNIFYRQNTGFYEFLGGLIQTIPYAQDCDMQDLHSATRGMLSQEVSQDFWVKKILRFPTHSQGFQKIFTKCRTFLLKSRSIGLISWTRRSFYIRGPKMSGTKVNPYINVYSKKFVESCEHKSIQNCFCCVGFLVNFDCFV